MSWRRYLFAQVDERPMGLGRLRQLFFPRAEHENPGLKKEILAVSVVGLRAVSLVLFGSVAWLIAMESIFDEKIPGWPYGHGATLVMGTLAIGLSYVSSLRPWARAMGGMLGIVIAAIILVTSLLFLPIRPAEDHHISGSLFLIILVMVAIFPFKPVHTFIYGTSIVVLHVVATFAVPYWFGTTVRGNPGHALLTSLGVLIAVGVSAVMYDQRVFAYQAKKAARQALQSLQEAQSRLLLAENAASQGRLAAALSHELNSPLGTLGSSLDTLQKSFQGSEVAPTQAWLSVISGARQASDRLSEVVGRMKRFTNLDRTDAQPCDLNQILSDTVGLLKSELDDRADTTLDLQPLPPITGKPQALAAVFSNLLRNAASAIEKRGHIWVTSTHGTGEISVEVRDDGRGISQEDVRHLFEPVFTVKDGRVTTSNWSLFSSRNVIAEHGGHIAVESTQGEGTSVKVSIPT